MFLNSTGEFCIDVDLVEEMAVINPFDFILDDDEPIWRDQSLIADESRAGDATDLTAGAFLRAVAERLWLEPCFSCLRRRLLLPLARAQVTRQR